MLDNLKAQLIQFTEQQKTAKQVSKNDINVSIYGSTRHA